MNLFVQKFEWFFLAYLLFHQNDLRKQYTIKGAILKEMRPLLEEIYSILFIQRMLLCLTKFFKICINNPNIIPISRNNIDKKTGPSNTPR